MSIAFPKAISVSVRSAQIVLGSRVAPFSRSPQPTEARLDVYFRTVAIKQHCRQVRLRLQVPTHRRFLIQRNGKFGVALPAQALTIHQSKIKNSVNVALPC
jgi:hypothetical protein